MEVSKLFETIGLPMPDVNYNKRVSLRGFEMVYNEDLLKDLISQFILDSDGDPFWPGKTIDFEKIIVSAFGLNRESTENIADIYCVKSCLFFINGIIFYSTRHDTFNPFFAMNAFKEAQYELLRLAFKLESFHDTRMDNLLSCVMENPEKWFIKGIIEGSYGDVTEYYCDYDKEYMKRIEKKEQEDGKEKG